MRRVLATESYSYGSLSLESISLEEGDAMADEAREARVEADSELDEADRAADISDSLEDIAEIADGIEEATPAETQLIDAAAGMAVAGEPDVAPEEVMPSMESYRGRRIAVESIRERAREIWKTIQAWLKKIWDKVYTFFYKFVGEIPRFRKAIASMRTRVEAASTKAIKKGELKFDVTTGTAFLRCKGSDIKDAKMFSASMKTLQTELSCLSNKIRDKAKSAERFADQIADFDPETTAILENAYVKGLIESLNKFDEFKQGTPDTKRFSGYDTYMDKDGLFNNSVLAYRTPSDTRNDNPKTAGDVVELVNHINRSEVLVIKYTERDKDAKDTIVFETMRTSDMLDILRNCDKVLDSAEDFRRGSALKDMDKGRKRLEAASEKATKTMDNWNKDPDQSADTRANIGVYKELLNYNRAFLRGCKEPAATMVSMSMQAVRQALSLCSQSLAKYE